MKIFLIVLVCAGLCSASSANSRIVGGSSTTIEKIPYQLGLSVKNTFKCGAVIISTTAALTSAQCVYGVAAADITLRAGSSLLSTLGTIHTVASTIIHPSYVATTYDYDIAVLKVTNAFTLGTGVATVTLPSLDETVAVGSAATVSGWGITTIGGTEYAGSLQSVNVPVVSTATCSAAYTRINAITDRMICAGYTTGGKDACAGDTGGPLVYANKLIGLVSWGASCGSVGSPGVYTRIAALRTWISTNGGV